MLNLYWIRTWKILDLSKNNNTPEKVEDGTVYPKIQMCLKMLKSLLKILVKVNKTHKNRNKSYINTNL